MIESSRAQEPGFNSPPNGWACVIVIRHSYEDEHRHDLRKDDGHNEHRMTREDLLGPRDAGKEERYVREVANNDDRNQRSASPIDPPAQNAVEQFDDERRRGRAGVQPEAQLRKWRTRPQRDVRSMGRDVENEMRDDPDGDRETKGTAAKTSIDDPPGAKSGSRHGSNRMRVPGMYARCMSATLRTVGSVVVRSTPR